MAKAPATAPAPAKYDFGDDIGGGTLVKWDVAKEVIGTYTGMTEQAGMQPGTKSYKATVDLLEPIAGMDIEVGEQAAFFAPAALKSRLDQIAVGSVIRIAYDGTTTKSAAGRPVKNFTVQVSGAGK